MSERKVLNKYYPPNFDPAKIPRVKRPKDAKLRHKVRLMAPFSMQCQTCGEYIYKGKKFNANKETVDGETYYSIRIFRFYIRCPKCHAEITFKTDPANLDYVAESGAVRNFEPWRDNEVVDDLVKDQRALEEELNPIKALENKTIDSKREMETLDQLDEMRMRNDRLHGVDVDQVLQQLISQDQRDAVAEEAELDRLAMEAFAGKRGAPAPNSSSIRDSDEEGVGDDEDIPVDLNDLMDQYRKSRASNAKASPSSPSSASTSTAAAAAASMSKKRENEWAKLVAKKKPKAATNQNPGAAIVSNAAVKKTSVQAKSPASSPQRQVNGSDSLPDPLKTNSNSLVAAYASDDDSDE